MQKTDIENRSVFDRSIAESLERASGQKDLFITLWTDEVLERDVRAMFKSDLMLRDKLPLLRSPFGDIFVEFVPATNAGALCMHAIFRCNDQHGEKRDFYTVAMRDLEKSWVDGSGHPLDWDGNELKANTVTMGEIVKRALAARLTMENRRLAAIRSLTN